MLAATFGTDEEGLKMCILAGRTATGRQLPHGMIVVLWCCVTGYGVTLKVIKPKYIIFWAALYFFQFLDINVLNYRYFYAN